MALTKGSTTMGFDEYGNPLPCVSGKTIGLFPGLVPSDPRNPAVGALNRLAASEIDRLSKRLEYNESQIRNHLTLVDQLREECDSDNQELMALKQALEDL